MATLDPVLHVVCSQAEINDAEREAEEVREMREQLETVTELVEIGPE